MKHIPRSFIFCTWFTLLLAFTCFPALVSAQSQSPAASAAPFSPVDMASPAQVTHESLFSASSKLSNAQSLQNKLAANGAVRVIAKINVPGFAKLQADSTSFQAIAPEMAASPFAAHRAALASTADQALTSAISATADIVQDKLSGTSVVHEQTFQFIPYAVFTVNAAGLSQLASLSEVLSIEEDIARPLPEIMPNPSQELSSPQLSSSVSVIGADNLWNQGYTGGGWYVAVLDTGLLTSHEFFRGKKILEACFTTRYSSENPTARLCPNGKEVMYDTGAAEPYPSTNDGYDHGTHVAGITSGKKPDGSLKGVAPDSNVIAIQVFSNGFTDTDGVLSYTSDQIEGLELVYAKRSQYPIASVNMSLGGGYFSTACDTYSASTKAAIDNLRNAGIATVIASGNEYYCTGVGDPSCISSSIAVGATDNTDVRADFSNWESDLVPLFAPGVSIYSSVAEDDSAYSQMSGTSMAAPHVAGAWALLRQYNQTASVDDVLTALKNTAKTVDFESDCGAPTGITRRIQVDEAAAAMTNPGTLPTVTTTAISSITAHSASGGGEVTDTGGTIVFARGVCWSTSSTPTVKNNKTHNGRQTGTYKSYLTRLDAETTYYVRAYAINAAGVGYGPEVTFTTGAAPQITSFSSTTGAAGDSITINGSNFADVSHVFFGNTAATSFTVNSTTEITAVVGNGSSGPVGVSTTNGVALSSSDFSYSGDATAPSIESFQPKTVAANNNVVIKGANFTDATGVFFGGVEASSYTVVNDSIIHATFGAGSTGVITVTTSQGTAVSSSQIFYAGDCDLRLIWKQGKTGRLAYAKYLGVQYTSAALLKEATFPDEQDVRAVGDFNGDGMADVIAHNPKTGRALSVFLQSGFSYKGHRFLDTNIPAPWDIFGAGDYNDDNYDDLILFNTESGEIAVVYLASGLTVSSIKKLDMSIHLEWKLVAVGDMNADTIPDLIFQNEDGMLGVIHITSSFTSGAIKRLDVAIPKEWTVVGAWDFNNDGRLDLMAKNESECLITAIYLDGDFGFHGHSPINGTWEKWFEEDWDILAPGEVF